MVKAEYCESEVQKLPTNQVGLYFNKPGIKCQVKYPGLYVVTYLPKA